MVSIGILRGAADTRAPFVIGLLGFWLLGFPVSLWLGSLWLGSLWLGFRTSPGAVGLWWGLVVRLAAVAVLLRARVPARLRRAVRRVAVDAAGTAADAGSVTPAV